jgi:RNA polymerase sigma-70 factor (ECF subfamily)
VQLEDDWIHIIEEETINETSFQFTLHAIESAIELLPDNYRTIFNLYVIENIPQTDIAQLLGLENTTVRVQYHRAKQKLLSILTNVTYYEQ